MAVFLPIHGGSPLEDEYENERKASTPTSPHLNTTFLADGYTEDGRLSRYDNVRVQFWAYSPGDLTLTTYDGLSVTEHPNQSVVTLHEDGTTSTQMLPRIIHQTDSDRDGGRCASAPMTTNNCFGKLKAWYDQSLLRHFAPFLVLALYAVLGAFAFYWVEHDNERRLLRKERESLEQLRNDTFLRLIQATVTGRSVENRRIGIREVLLWYEKELMRIKLPEALEWDIMGALFFVGTLFTTIGYGNITPRTTGGQALSIVYAIFGIPLVLAILNQFSKKLTKWVSDVWISYREKVRFEKAKRLARQRTIRLSAKSRQRAMEAKQRRAMLNNRDIESGRGGESVDEEDEEDEETESNAPESRTIPVWVALSVCVGYICMIAAIFLLWETRWTYFTSFYFICISCLTIGLGDVIPDHPHMLILMFVFVILGLSIVSMLLSVIQIKIEEWLYRMMIKMHKKYQKALEKVSDPVERERIITEMKQKEPWFLRNLAPMIVSQSQADKIEHMAESFEKVLRVTNNKNVQTESIDAVIGTGASSRSTTPPMVSAVDTFNLNSIKVGNDEHLSESAKLIEGGIQMKAAGFGLSAPDADSISDATSLPMDPVNGVSAVVDQSVQVDLVSICEHSIQTEIAQFQLDELKMKLHDMEEQARSKPILVDVGAGTVARYFAEQMAQTEDAEEDEEKGPQMVDSYAETQRQYFAEQASQTEIVTREHQGIQSKPTTENKSVCTQRQVFESRGMETEMCQLINRSMETMDGSLWRGGECSRSVQTMFPSTEEVATVADIDDTAEINGGDADTKRRRFSNSRLTAHNNSFEEDEHMIEIGIQCSLVPSSDDICDVGVQTAVSSMDFNNALSHFPGLQKAAERDVDVDTLELPDSDDLQRSRRSSSIFVATENDEAGEYLVRRPKVVKQDLIIQTDDSYLKIARRLNEYRTNKTSALQVYATPFATPPGGRKGEQPSTSDAAEKPRRPRVSVVQFQEPSRDQTPPPDAVVEKQQRERDSSGERGGMVTRFLEPAAQKLRASIRKKTTRKPAAKAEGNRQEMESLEVGSASPKVKKSSRLPTANNGGQRRRDSIKSLTPSLVEGRVSDYVAKHERGIHNPGTAKGLRNSRVTVVDMRKQRKDTVETNPDEDFDEEAK